MIYTLYLCCVQIRDMANTDKKPKVIHLDSEVTANLLQMSKDAGFPNIKNYMEWVLINHSKLKN